MANPNYVQPGIQLAGDGAVVPARGGRQGESMVSELHGRFYEQTYRNNVYSGGMALTAINNATFTSATLGVTCTPIIGVWNPASSPVNLVLLQATLAIALTALTNTGPGPFVWAVSTGNAAISTGAAPWNRKSLVQAGSYAKNMAGVALTGMTNNLVVIHASVLDGGSTFNISNVDTAAGFSTIQSASVENFDGSFIIPPGGVIALLGTTTAVAHSAASALLWEEVPV
jgi:hypothetical protein